MMVRVAAWWGLLTLPGAWIAFGRFPARGFSSRLAAAIALSPAIACCEYYVCRLLHIPFEATVVLLAAVNLPALILIARRLPERRRPRLRAAGWWLLLAIPMATFVPHILSAQARAYTGHGWLFSDTAYQFANGAMLPEDSMLAGVRLAYPSSGILYQTVLARILNAPPAACYLWLNLAMLGVVVSFISRATRELGGDDVAAAAAPLWLLLGVNALGDFMRWLVPGSAAWSEGLWADGRFSPWYAKFFFFQEEPLAFALFALLLYCLVSGGGAEVRRPRSAVTVGLLLTALGMLYPILFPAACALLIWPVLRWMQDGRGKRSQRAMVALVAVVAAAGALTVMLVKAVTVARTAPSVVLGGGEAAWKLLSLGIILLPLLIGAAPSLRTAARFNRRATGLLLFGAAGSCGLYAAFHLPGWSNEYKFIFTAGLCLAPLAGLGTSKVRKRLGRAALPAFAALVVVMALPLCHRLAEGYPLDSASRLGPRLDLSRFDLDIAPGADPLGEAAKRIRERTPPRTIVVAEESEIHLPTITQRSLYAPIDDDESRFGVGMSSRQTLLVARGYDPSVLSERWETVHALFNGSPGRRRRALQRMLSLGRPVAVVFSTKRHPDLAAALRIEGPAEVVCEGGRMAVLLMGAGSARTVR